jgi:hypothetical protein
MAREFIMFKKILIISFIMYTSFSLSAQSYELGDVDHNRKINIVDALLVAQYYVNLPTDNFDTSLADVNCTQSITITDALLIAQYYVGLISGFNCGTPTLTPAPTQTPYDRTGLVYISPETQTVHSGGHFTTGITVNTGGDFYVYLEFVIYYDDRFLVLDHRIGEGGIEETFGLPIAEIENSDGILRIKAENPPDAMPGYDAFTSYYIHWVSRYETNVKIELNMEVENLYNNYFEPIGNPRGQDGIVDILHATPLPGAGKVWSDLYPYYLNINWSNDFYLRMNMGTQPIDSYTIRITYDPAVITINTVEEYLLSSDDKFTIEYTNENGVLTITGNKLADATIDPSTNFYFLKINYTGTGVGNADLEIHVDELTDIYGFPIGDPVGELPGDITVLANPTPMPGSLFFKPETYTAAGGDSFTTPLRFSTTPEEYAYYTIIPEILVF